MEDFKRIFQDCPDGLLIIDEKRTILEMNPAMERLTGWRAEEVVGRRECQLLFGCSDSNGKCIEEGSCPGLKATGNGEPTAYCELGFTTREGKKVTVSASYNPIPYKGRNCAIGAMKEITLQNETKGKRRPSKERVDELTGLLARSAFVEALAAETERARRLLHPFSLIVIDIDRFKTDDSQSRRSLGNFLLARVAYLILGTIREIDLMARFEGGRFAILLPETVKREGIQTAVRLRRMVQHTDFQIQGKKAEGTVTISLGVASLPFDASEPVSLIQAAESALEVAKKQGGNRVSWCRLGGSQTSS
ncbi:MAG TPA: diguanylate cyclase [Nitrospiria bacterium]|nr:diguanylate cyclase [Nitrospiria bacterium]